jgi:hypothetical protein
MAHIFKIDGAGAGTCRTCGRLLDFSWLVILSDGTSYKVCSLHVPAH